MAEPTELPSRDPNETAKQLEILLNVARSIVEEEVVRSARFDSRSHNQMTIVAAFFALVQTAVIALLNGSLVGGGTGTLPASFHGWEPPPPPLSLPWLLLYSSPTPDH
jgi:hypothetical protein